MKEPRNRSKWLEERIIICDCGYNNHKEAIDIYGSCIMCGKILDDRAYFRYQLKKKLKPWKGKGGWYR